MYNILNAVDLIQLISVQNLLFYGHKYESAQSMNGYVTYLHIIYEQETEHIASSYGEFPYQWPSGDVKLINL